jgi:hypothetical protein
MLSQVFASQLQEQLAIGPQGGARDRIERALDSLHGALEGILSLALELLFGFDLGSQHREFHMQFLTATSLRQGCD